MREFTFVWSVFCDIFPLAVALPDSRVGQSVISLTHSSSSLMNQESSGFSHRLPADFELHHFDRNHTVSAQLEAIATCSCVV